MPALRAAEEALKAISQKDITMIKTVLNPTADTLMVMSAVLILLRIEPLKKMNPETQKKESFYWPPTQKCMNSGHFLQDLLEYNKDAIDITIINKLKPFTEQPKFNKEDLMSVSPVVANIASWVLAMFKYYHVNLIVVPKKAALAKAQGEYDVVAKTLKIK